MSAGEDKYWYNLTTGAVERGFESPAIDRAGPFEPEPLAEGTLHLGRRDGDRGGGRLHHPDHRRSYF